MLKSDEDKGNSKYADYYGRAVSLYTQYSSKTAFSGPEIIAIPDEVLERFYEEKPELKFSHACLTGFALQNSTHFRRQKRRCLPQPVN
jgi:oligoendopeptidase F